MSPTSFQTAPSRVNNKFSNSNQTITINGSRWIRTTEAICSRFTVCPLWPLGNRPIFNYHCIPLLREYKADDRTRTDNLLITDQLLCQLSHIGIIYHCEVSQVIDNGTYRARTYDPLLVRQMLSQLS